MEEILGFCVDPIMKDWLKKKSISRRIALSDVVRETLWAERDKELKYWKDKSSQKKEPNNE